MTYRIFGALALVAALCAAPAARAASVVIWPVDPTIGKDQRATALWLENKGGQPVAMQVRALAWSQGGGADRLQPQDDVVASPPVFTVEPGRRQLIRIIRIGAPPGPGERSYRLLVDELPPPVTAGVRADAGASTRLAVQMRYSVPLFTYAGTVEAGAPALRAHLALDEGRRVLVVTNDGTQHARLMDLRLRAGGRAVPVLPGLLGHVLPGATMRWPLPADAPAGEIVLSVNGRDVALSGSV